MRFAPWTVLLLALSFAACDSAESLVIGGTYVGVTDQSGSLTITATVVIPETESGETFTFEATVTEAGPGGSDEARFTGTGTYTHPALTLTADGDTATGVVTEGGDSFRLEVDAGQFVLFTRQ